MEINDNLTHYIPDDNETIHMFCEALQKAFDDGQPLIEAVQGVYKGIYLEANKDTSAYSLLCTYDKVEDDIKKRTHAKELNDIYNNYQEERKARSLSGSTFGQLFVNDIIDRAMQKKDRYVTLYFGEAGTSVNIYPMTEEESDDQI